MEEEDYEYEFKKDRRLITDIIYRTINGPRDSLSRNRFPYLTYLQQKEEY